MMRGTPRRSETNQSFDEEIGKIPEQLRKNFYCTDLANPVLGETVAKAMACSSGNLEEQHITSKVP
jgi:hypothetical protein